MDHKRLKFDLMKNELQNFQRQRQHQNQKGSGKNSSGVEGSCCAANGLVEKLIKILENEVETEMQRSPEEKALSNSLVVREILSYLNIPSLLKFRQVSRLWKEEATSILLSSKPENILCLKFYWWATGGEFCTAEMYLLSDFMKAFRDNWSIFQFTQLIFTGGQINEPTLVQFFSEYGSHVEHLGLFPASVFPSEAVQNIIFKWTPNLKSLAVTQNVLEIEDENGNPNRSLLNLETLILPKSLKQRRLNGPQPERPLLQKILTSATNLTSIQDDQLAYIPQIISAGKLSLVKSITWDFSNGFPFWKQNFLQFAAAGGQLRSLTLEGASNTRSQTILDALRTLFQQGQNTLENVKGVEELCVISDPTYKLPPLYKVTELNLYACKPPPERILPQGNALSDVFPNLKRMKVQVHGNVLYPLTSPLNAHSGLKKLKIFLGHNVSSFRFRSECVESLSNLYPKLTHLHFELNVGNFTDCLGLISMHFVKLEELVLEIGMKDNTSLKFKRAMDLALSGLPQEICEQLRSSQDPNPKYQKMEVLDEIRIASSIIDLKKLTSLTFVLYFEKSPEPIWTHVAEFYAFQPMIQRQGLEVNVRGFQNQSVMCNGSELRPV